MRHMEMATTILATGISTDAVTAATPPPAGGNVHRWLQLIRAEYLEIPGLCLTEPQARRLWGLDDLTADALLSALVNAGFLRRTRGGRYIRTDQG